jgi:DNA-binding NtrC family response regulator
MKAFGLGDIERFPFINMPAAKAIRAGYGLLEELGALAEMPAGEASPASAHAEAGEGSRLAAARQLTPVGRELARLPVDPTVGRMILQARSEKALREIVVIAAGLSILSEALKLDPECLVIVMTGKASVRSSIDALRAGAWSYLPKPFSAMHLTILVGRAAHSIVVAREGRTRRQDGNARAGKVDAPVLLGTSQAFGKVVEAARQVARTDAAVFITGESGTGKELIAQFIHRHSRRSSREMVSINSAALPEPLLESEMFGHLKGAFTGATKDKKGLLEAANGGTLFLDEIAEMPPSLQAKLLRVVQDGIIRRVGSVAVDGIVNVRFIAATNQDPMEAVASGNLRKDLF